MYDGGVMDIFADPKVKKEKLEKTKKAKKHPKRYGKKKPIEKFDYNKVEWRSDV